MNPILFNSSVAEIIPRRMIGGIIKSNRLLRINEQSTVFCLQVLSIHLPGESEQTTKYCSQDCPCNSRINTVDPPNIGFPVYGKTGR
jgi:hypothetical protein